MDALSEHWAGNIDELVAQANTVLSEVLPADRAGRPKDEVNARLVRHYTTQGLLPAPWREGREARYSAQHLLHLLALRRLMADGLGGKALYAALDGKDLEQLSEIVALGTLALGGLMINQNANANFALAAAPPPAPAPVLNAALDYVQSLKLGAAPLEGVVPAPSPLQQRRSSSAKERAEEFALPAALSKKMAPSHKLLSKKARQLRMLRQLEVRPGLDVQVATDFAWPVDEAAWFELLAELEGVLQELAEEETAGKASRRSPSKGRRV